MELNEVLVGGGAIAAAMAAMGVLARFVWRAWRKVDAFLEDWNGEKARPGRDARPSMPERMSLVEGRLSNVEHQVTPNGGNTSRLGDRVVRIERELGTEPDGT